MGRDFIKHPSQLKFQVRSRGRHIKKIECNKCIKQQLIGEFKDKKLEILMKVIIILFQANWNKLAVM